jgi:hypothetical protein
LSSQNHAQTTAGKMAENALRAKISETAALESMLQQLYKDTPKLESESNEIKQEDYHELDSLLFELISTKSYDKIKDMVCFKKNVKETHFGKLPEKEIIQPKIEIVEEKLPKFFKRPSMKIRLNGVMCEEETDNML